MKRIDNPGALLLYNGYLARVIGIGEGRTITLEYVDRQPCPSCGEPTRVHVLEHSPLFQDNAEPVETVHA